MILTGGGTDKSFNEALLEAFKKTGISKELFSPTKWAKDINGKTGIVEWTGPGGAEVSVDAPHTLNGPDVFHIGFKSPGKRNKIIDHIFLDCVPYFR